jgi:methylated-DNA-[protein]-cysteine S-methyltransferase
MSHLTIDSPIGPLTPIASDDGLRGIRFANDRARPVTDGPADPDHPVLSEAARQLDEYFAGERQQFDLPLEPAGTEFQLAAWQALTRIPYGRTVSYGEQARRLGLAGKARAVGAANGRNPLPIVVPCHRVIGADGSLVGFGGGLEVKAWLLDHERRVAGETLPL